MKRFVTIISFALIAAFITGCPKKQTIVKEDATALAAEAKRAAEEKAKVEAEEKMKAEAEEKARKEAEEKAKAAKEFGFEGVYFDFDKYDIKEEYREGLRQKAAWLLKNRDINIAIEGHSDDVGSNEYNLALGDRRANSVKTYLMNLGVDASRMGTVAYGEEMPACTEPTEECRWRNRRAAFSIGLMSIGGTSISPSPLP